MSIDIEKMKQDIERMKKEREQEDIERGYCVLPMPYLPDPFCLELLERTETKARPFLIRYTKLVYDTGEVIDVDMTRIKEWYDDFCIASEAREIRVTGKAMEYVIALNALIHKEMYRDAAPELARRLYVALEESDGKARLYSGDVPAEDYEYNYDELYEMAKEAMTCREKLYRNYDRS